MKLSKRIQAFTLSEILVVLILTVIVVGLAFSVLSLIQKQMYSIQSNFEQSSEINRLEMALQIDFHSYSEIRLDSQLDELKFKTETDSIYYKFSTDNIIREKDTFNISIFQKSLFFNGETINDSGLVDAIKLQTSKDTQVQPIFVFKQNDASQFMNDF
ncbi:hypothetical protein [Winogradskyella wandonensis]|uniref:hypothetical protein n=1 Tax=Winogradskyella wandonensis TaxID=1442586 RepID=UPI001F5402EE|nr:hypothetical protein [Winogradskyella wandonensis]